MIQKRVVLAFAFLLGSVHWLLSLSNDPYAQATSETVSLLAEKWRQSTNSSSLSGSNSTGSRFDYIRNAFNDMSGGSPTATTLPSCPTGNAPWLSQAPTTKRANATLVMLARNSEIYDVISSVKSMEDRFNRRFNYPWVFLNDEEFTEEFKSRISALSNANITFGKIPHDHWHQPSHIDERRATISRAHLVAQNVLYGGSVSYRNMCRFNSGFFFQHELLKPYKYYWRVEPNVKYFCDLDTDPFLVMQEGGKSYGFTIALEELPQTVPSLWKEVRRFMKEHPEMIAKKNALSFLSHDDGKSFNMCHFWSNFEIADLDFWRSEAYTTFFNALDSAGGFYYERWGDAPVHSIAAALLLPKDKLHFFADIGYRHEPFQHCPQGELHVKGRCSCDPSDNFDYQGFASCMDSWDELWAKGNEEEEEEEKEKEKEEKEKEGEKEEKLIIKEDAPKFKFEIPK